MVPVYYKFTKIESEFDVVDYRSEDKQIVSYFCSHQCFISILPGGGGTSKKVTATYYIIVYFVCKSSHISMNGVLGYKMFKNANATSLW